jgi:hypothetical protein
VVGTAVGRQVEGIAVRLGNALGESVEMDGRKLGVCDGAAVVGGIVGAGDDGVIVGRSEGAGVRTGCAVGEPKSEMLYRTKSTKPWNWQQLTLDVAVVLISKVPFGDDTSGATLELIKQV